MGLGTKGWDRQWSSPFLVCIHEALASVPRNTNTACTCTACSHICSYVIVLNLRCEENVCWWWFLRCSPADFLLVPAWQELPVNEGIELLQLVLNFEMKDPLILSCVLTNVSALFPFVTYKPAFLPQVFSKVWSHLYEFYFKVWVRFCNCLKVCVINWWRGRCVFVC